MLNLIACRKNIVCVAVLQFQWKRKLYLVRITARRVSETFDDLLVQMAYYELHHGVFFSVAGPAEPAEPASWNCITVCFQRCRTCSTCFMDGRDDGFVPVQISPSLNTSCTSRE